MLKHDFNQIEQEPQAHQRQLSRQNSIMSSSSSSARDQISCSEQPQPRQPTASSLRSGLTADSDEVKPRLKADFVLVYHDKKPKERVLKSRSDASFIATKQRLIFLENLAQYGLEIEKVNAKNNVVYVLIRTPFKILLDVAENLKVKLPIQVQIDVSLVGGCF